MSATFGQDFMDAVQSAAYAEGRADERQEWLPVLEALTFYANNIFRRRSTGELCIQTAIEHDGGNRARAAIAHIEGKS